MLFKLFLTGVALFLGNNIYHISKNYVAARRIGLPIIICPATWQNPLWMLVASIFRVRKLSWIPGLRWTRYSYIGWVLHDRHKTRDELGPAFTIVSPYKNEVILADPHAIAETMGKIKKWLRPREMYVVFSQLGENVNTVDPENWQRHRKVLNAGFAEGNMGAVWEAATKQARQWADQNEQTMSLEDLTKAANKVSLNVLMDAGFGQRYDFDEEGLEDVEENHKKSFAASIEWMVSNFMFSWVCKNIRMPALIQPRKITELHNTLSELKIYFNDIIEKRSGSFVKALVEANENEKQSGKGHLSQDELYGNMYILNLAGYDTSSYALEFTLALLSVTPDLQDWILDGLVEDGSYEENFHKAVRCRAAIMETLRLYTAAPNLERVSPNAETLRIGETDYVIPPDTVVGSNFPSIHTDPKIWGGDAEVWKPQRWIEVVDGVETLRNRFEMMAWATGPRSCPGKKFSMIEVTGAITTLLSRYRLKGTSNMQEVLDDFEFKMTPKPNKPEEAKIEFIKRK